MTRLCPIHPRSRSARHKDETNNAIVKRTLAADHTPFEKFSGPTLGDRAGVSESDMIGKSIEDWKTNNKGPVGKMEKKNEQRGLGFARSPSPTSRKTSNSRPAAPGGASIVLALAERSNARGRSASRTNVSVVQFLTGLDMFPVVLSELKAARTSIYGYQYQADHSSLHANHVSLQPRS